MNAPILFVILAICVANSYQSQTFKQLKGIWHGHLMKFIHQCENETGVDRRLAERLLPYGEYVEDEKLKCFTKCIGQKLDMVGESGEVHHDTFMNILSIEHPSVPETAHLYDICFEIFDVDPCKRVFEISKCVHRSVEKALDFVHTEL